MTIKICPASYGVFKSRKCRVAACGDRKSGANLNLGWTSRATYLRENEALFACTKFLQIDGSRGIGLYLFALMQSFL